MTRGRKVRAWRSFIEVGRLGGGGVGGDEGGGVRGSLFWGVDGWVGGERFG